MKSMRRWMLAGVICLGGVSTMSVAGCAHSHHEWVDNHGYHHTGYYDRNHAWHGGYTDERGVHHEDPPDWHH